jgi:putative endopeptidase
MNIKHLLPMMMAVAAPIVGAQGQSKSGLDLSNLDKSVSPANDFYKFATGGWQKLNPLPAAYSRYGSFDMLQENVNKQVNSILTDLTKKTYKEGTTERKLSDFYKLAMDQDRRNREGLAPVKPLLDEIEAAKTLDDLKVLQLKYAKIGYGVPFSSWFGADDKNVDDEHPVALPGWAHPRTERLVCQQRQGHVEVREAFRKHIVRMFKLYGFSEAQAQAKGADIFRFETMLALISRATWSCATRRPTTTK